MPKRSPWYSPAAIFLPFVERRPVLDSAFDSLSSGVSFVASNVLPEPTDLREVRHERVSAIRRAELQQKRLVENFERLRRQRSGASGTRSSRLRAAVPATRTAGGQPSDRLQLRRSSGLKSCVRGMKANSVTDDLRDVGGRLALPLRPAKEVAAAVADRAAAGVCEVV